jgi:hypothetical protein
VAKHSCLKKYGQPNGQQFVLTNGWLGLRIFEGGTIMIFFIALGMLTFAIMVIGGIAWLTSKLIAFIDGLKDNDGDPPLGV